MIRTVAITVLTLLSASPTRAESIVTPEAFERLATGTTVYFNRQGQPYGAEQYFPDRRVIWTFLDGQCQQGIWFPEDDGICFRYDPDTVAICWHFLESESGLSARVIGDDPANDLIVSGQDKQALKCPGPAVGVGFTPGG